MIVPFLMALYLTLFPVDTPLLVEASASYIHFSSIHSLGYPVFLQLIELFSDRLSEVVHTQIWLFAFALTCLSLSIRKISASNWLAFFVILPILANPFVLLYHFNISPNSLFISATLLMLASLISAFGQARFRNLFSFGLFTGICITLLPMGWAYIILIFFCSMLISQQKQCGFLKAFIIPLGVVTLITLLESTTFNTLHDEEKESQLASYLFASSSMMQTSQPSPYATKDPRTHIWTLIENDLSTKRNEIWQLKDFTSKENLLIETEENIRLDFAQKEFEFAETILEKSINDIQMDIATSRIIQDPIAFIEICIIHYQGLWESDELIAYGFWFTSLVCVVLSLWFLITGVKFVGGFSAAFASGLAIQAQTIWIAITGLGPDNVIVSLSPLLTISLCCVLVGFYVTYVKPVHTYD